MTQIGAREDRDEQQARLSQERLDELLGKSKLSAYELGAAAALARRGGTAAQRDQVNDRARRATAARKAKRGDGPATLADVKSAMKKIEDAAVDRISREVGLFED
jgi:hypothetical protein